MQKIDVKGTSAPKDYQSMGGRGRCTATRCRAVTEQRKRYRENKIPKKSEYRKPYTRTSVHECQNRLFEVVCILRCAITSASLPKYLTPKSNHVYSYQQKIALIVLRQYFDISYDRVGEVIGSNPIITDILDLDFIPERSTLCKFSQTVDHEHLKLVINQFQMIMEKEEVLSMDGTKLSNYNRSAHFEFRLKDFRKEPPKRTFTTAALVIGTENKMIYAADVSTLNKHDVRYVPELVRQLKSGKANGRIGYIVADKGYDSEAMHKLVRKELVTRFIVPPRDPEWTPVKHTGGHYRRRMRQLLGVKCSIFSRVYRMRCIVETVNSMLKKVFGSSLKAIRDKSRVTEVYGKIIAHNLRVTVNSTFGWKLR